MMRNLIVLGFAGLLMIGLSWSTIAGTPPDTDGDGVPDASDNCLVLPNGPDLQSPLYPMCNTQLDGDSDGYGNPCDTDTDNDGAAGLSDVSQTLAAVKVVSTDPNFDFNCDGAAGLDDLSHVLADSKVVLTPGPSGLACAGTVPCP